MRQRLAKECEQHSYVAGQIEVDESYLGPKRIRGKRDRGAGSKTIVFGLFKLMVGSIRKLSLTSENVRCKARYTR